jgi:hypothetical protein
MPIGKVGRGRRKRHPKHKTPRRRQVGTEVLRLPGKSGFLSLQASALHQVKQQRLVVTVTAKRHPDNRGPGLLLKHVEEEWHRAQNADGTLRKLLKRLLAETAERVQGRLFPERGVFLDQCSRGDEMEFLQNVCSGCRCWYCDLSEA